LRRTLVLQHLIELFTANTNNYKIWFLKLFAAEKAINTTAFSTCCHESGTLNRAWQAVLHIVLVLVTQ
jgi:hypothetical protein